MSKKSYWTTKAGKAAIRQAAATDAAGAMRVSPANFGSGGGDGIRSSIGRAPNMGIDPGSLPNRSVPPVISGNFQNKLVSQGPTTGFGSFRTTDTTRGGPVGVDNRSGFIGRTLVRRT